MTASGKADARQGWTKKATTTTSSISAGRHSSTGCRIELLVSDGPGNKRVLKFDKDGKFILKWGSEGTGPGQFNAARHCGGFPRPPVFVSDRSNRRIQVFDENGKFLDQWPNVAPHTMISRRRRACLGVRLAVRASSNTIFWDTSSSRSDSSARGLDTTWAVHQMTAPTLMGI
jgi:hypothetical protein